MAKPVVRFVAGFSAVAVAGTVLVAPAAVAGDVAFCNALYASLMQNSDIPSWLGTTRIRTANCRQPARPADRPLACFQNQGADVYGLPPRAWGHASIKLGGSEKLGSALEAGNTIYPYQSRPKAKQAWVDFETKARGCPPDATIVRGSGTESVTIRQTTTFSKISKFQGRNGFALTHRVWIRGTGQATFRARAVDYVAFRLVGKTIVRVYLNKSTQVSTLPISLRPKDKAWVRKETLVVAKRVLRQPVLR